MITAIIIFFLLAGIFFFSVGVVGLLRLPDVFCRMHATTKCDTLGAGLMLFALMIYHGFAPDSIKLAFIICFIWLTNPTAAHIIAKASYQDRVKMTEGSFELDYSEEESA